ncbi:hypothetical protein MSG28_015792 [Choristoneura fumiferana]|uniref:Uncharacterized protein n=1 Tax=Choristoneura fumiferana TaxID=7141 RepID=A0ACC0KC06_CHOFU|nr:hypothetical protein MSG28_015792 [Choristoneura fumiferana]
MTEASENVYLVRVRAQVMCRDEGTGGWVALGGGGLADVMVGKRHPASAVLGCVDGTLIPIIRPSQHEERYYCRKQFHSLNVQLICDANMQITSIDASFGGATHDSFIWNCHPIKTFLEGLNEATWLLGK